MLGLKSKKSAPVGYRLVYDSPPRLGGRQIASDGPVPLVAALDTFDWCLGRGGFDADTGRRLRVMTEVEYQRVRVSVR
jgi:hypothetical protein